jgi:hypothetical protein
MQIQINIDSNSEGNDRLAYHVEAVVRDALDRFSTQITRLEVHLCDNSDKNFGTEDKGCLLEARRAGLQPIALTYQAAALEQAVDGAVEKLTRSVESSLGRVGKHLWTTPQAEGGGPHISRPMPGPRGNSLAA